MKKFIHILEEAIHLDKADMGLIQLFDLKKEILRVIAQKGFKKDFLELFKTVRAFDPSAYGRALGLRSPITISDVTLDIALAPFIKIIRAAGFRAVKSIPVITKCNELIGVISTHFKEPKWQWDTDTLCGPVEKLIELCTLNPRYITTEGWTQSQV